MTELTYFLPEHGQRPTVLALLSTPGVAIAAFDGWSKAVPSCSASGREALRDLEQPRAAVPDSPSH